MAGDGLAQRVDLGVGRLVRATMSRSSATCEAVAMKWASSASRRSLSATVWRSDATSALERAHRLDAGAQRLGLALELVQAAAVVAG